MKEQNVYEQVQESESQNNIEEKKNTNLYSHEKNS